MSGTAHGSRYGALAGAFATSTKTTAPWAPWVNRDVGTFPVALATTNMPCG